MLAIAHACAVIGIDGVLVEVQVDFNPRSGIPSFAIVGLPDSAVRESRERVRAAIKNSQLQFPNKGYIVNLSPADLPKHSTAYDLAIAVGVLAATDQIPLPGLERALFIGELSLDGRIRHVQGVTPMAYAACQAGYETIYLSVEDAPHAAMIEGIQVMPVETLGHLVEHLYGLNPIQPLQSGDIDLNEAQPTDEHINFAHIKGQEHTRRALEIAAAGNHNVRMVGPPGSGKSLLARALPTILPAMTFAEALEVTQIYSVSDLLTTDQPLVTQRPFQNPHHTISSAGLVGGGSIPRPGAVSLSHRGVLFLDEINEFPTRVLELLRQPIEDKVVTISRAKQTLTFPSNFMLIAAHNPCPCGYYGSAGRDCSCTPSMIRQYQSRLSGPLLDRIDMHVYVPPVEYDKLMNDQQGEASESIRARVESARRAQQARFHDYPAIYANGDMGAGEVQKFCVLTGEARQLLELSVRKMQLSARSYHRMLKLSRTIADLEGSESIAVTHVAEGLQYRSEMLE
jgi:magnesium chelatase family protein